MKTSLTTTEKLKAFAFTFYHSSIHTKWQPKKGDYYTTTREDLELYQIVDEDDEHLYTNYVNGRSDSPTKWSKKEFLDPNGFGSRRLWIPEWCFESQPHSILLIPKQ